MMAHLKQGSLLVPSDSEAFRRQENISAVLNLLLCSALLLIHTLFSAHFGNPGPMLMYLLATGFFLLVLELVWLQGKAICFTQAAMKALTWASIGLNLGLAAALALLTDRQDSPYFVLLVVPVLVSAFRLSLMGTLAVAVTCDGLTFFWVWHFAHYHGGPVAPTEYFEAGSLSLIFTVVAVLAWMLVDNLRRQEQRLRENFAELERTRERLVAEEKLAAVGRLSSAIAHEIRNPVAMVSSSLATAMRGSLDDRRRAEMFEIAAQEATRLEMLTNDFLAYARPRAARPANVSIRDTLEYVATACRARAGERRVSIEVEAPGLELRMDAVQMQQALINLVMNAIDASPQDSGVRLRLVAGEDKVCLEVENSGVIAPETAARVFEPFFTTKTAGTGLGLAIARNLVHANGGEIELAAPGPPHVCFRITLPGSAAVESDHAQIRRSAASAKD